MSKAALSLGPLLFHWTAETRRDFYFRIADEADVATVHLGEVVCSKRAPFFDPHLPEVAERLSRSGKEVVFSTLALVTGEREMAMVRGLAEMGHMVEANDVAAIQVLAGRPHAIGPFINLFNEDTLRTFARLGAVRAATHPELPADTIAKLAKARGALEIEVTVFGRLALSVSARCYHARAHGLAKDSCQYVCGNDADGKPVETLDHQPILAVNGTQTMSHGYVNLLGELAALRAMGVTRFRLSPQALDMVAVAALYREALDGRIGADDAQAKLRSLAGPVPFIDGYYQGREGLAWSEAAE
ncbi:MAG: U32 family peptidase [Rhodospirillales bacterium]|nr:U32 family peptidase [Rhodospirillales bacterium]